MIKDIFHLVFIFALIFITLYSSFSSSDDISITCKDINNNSVSQVCKGDICEFIGVDFDRSCELRLYAVIKDIEKSISYGVTFNFYYDNCKEIYKGYITLLEDEGEIKIKISDEDCYINSENVDKIRKYYTNKMVLEYMSFFE